MPWSPSSFGRLRLGSPLPSARQEVNVDVIHDLAPLGTAVHAKPVAALGQPLGLAECASGQEAATDDIRVPRSHRSDRSDVALGDDEEMDGRLRVDVLEGQDRLVFVLDVGGSLAGHDAAEYAVLQQDPP